MVSAGTLSDSPEFVVDLTSRRRAVQTQASEGFVQRRQVQSAVTANTDKAEVRQWRLRWSAAPQSVHDNVLTLWNASFGGAVEITWTPVDEGSAISALFMGAPDLTRVSAATYAITVDLEEVL